MDNTNVYIYVKGKPAVACPTCHQVTKKEFPCMWHLAVTSKNDGRILFTKCGKAFPADAIERVMLISSRYIYGDYELCYDCDIQKG